MIEKNLVAIVERVFGLQATFDIPGDSREQECIFIQVERNHSSIRDGFEIGRLSGRLRIFVNSAKMPFGYVAKCIDRASSEDVKNLFFYEIEENAGTFANIVEKSMGFVFFYKNQYNPERGDMNEVTFTTEVTE